ncbi:MAG: dienelactone hydrolase family protein [Bacteroidetes bacterium]|nr:dienelactone hydrolase family protein [Bacteroidota bacterium]
MRKILLFLGLLPVCFLASAQEKPSCCAASATESFSQLASDKNFAMSHQNPLPYSYQDENGKAIVYKAADGTDAYGWEIKSKKPSNNYLLVIHEWWGLNDYIKKESEQIWHDLGNVNVIALDLYDKKVARTREDAAKYMQAVTNERAVAIIKGAIAYAGGNAKIYTIGWCFGGGWSLQASLLAGKQADGCVIYYGMPEKDVEKLKTLHADVLGIFGSRDQWINPKVVDEFAENMKKAEKKLVVKSYDADHAFANPSNPSFDKNAKEDAYKMTIAFLKKRIK